MDSQLKAALKQTVQDSQNRKREVLLKEKQEIERELARLRQMIQDSWHRKLEALLKAEEWKEADEETYQLMITMVGKEVGQYFTADELLNFPCEELRAIDELWVDYSKGRFGFSVQKDIYADCGARLDGKYPGDEIWVEFGNRVGWIKKNEWQHYSQLDPSFSSPEGIFPCRGCDVWQGFKWDLGWGSLLSHTDL